MKCRKNYKRRSALPRKIIASGLSAAFCAGTASGSYAGAAELENPPVNQEANGKLILPELEHHINQNLSEDLRQKIEAFSEGLYNSVDFSRMLRFLLGNKVEGFLYGGKNTKAKLDPVVIESLGILNEDRGMLLDTFILLLIDNNFDNECITFAYFLTFLNSFKLYKNPDTLSRLVKSRVKSSLTTFSDFFKAHKHVFIQKVKIEKPEVKLVDPGVKIKKPKEWKRIIIISVISIVVIISVFLILRFTLGSKENEVSPNDPNENNNNKGENTNTPGKNKNGDGTKQNDGEGSGILGKSLVTGAGIAGGIGTKFAADKILGHSEQDGNNEKSEKNEKNRDGNGPYTYIDSTGKVVSKAEGKGASDNIENADTDASDTEQPEILDGSEKIEKTKAENGEGKGVSNNIENADTDVPDTEQSETPNEAEKVEETKEEKGEN